MANPNEEVEKPIPESELDPRTRAQARKELHERKQAERKANSEQLKAEYAALRDNPAMLDIIAKLKSFKAYHNKLAVDGIGAKQVGNDDDNRPIIEEYVLTDTQVARELGGTSALEQLNVYIENQLS